MQIALRDKTNKSILSTKRIINWNHVTAGNPWSRDVTLCFVLLDIARQTADHEVRLLSFYKAIIVDCGGQEDGFMSYPWPNLFSHCPVLFNNIWVSYPVTKCCAPQNKHDQLITHHSDDQHHICQWQAASPVSCKHTSCPNIFK